MAELVAGVWSPLPVDRSGAFVGVALGEAAVACGGVGAGIEAGPSVPVESTGCDVGSWVGVGGAGAVSATVDSAGASAVDPGEHAVVANQRTVRIAKAGRAIRSLRLMLIILATHPIQMVWLVTQASSVRIRRSSGYPL